MDLWTLKIWLRAFLITIWSSERVRDVFQVCVSSDDIFKLCCFNFSNHLFRVSVFIPKPVSIPCIFECLSDNSATKLTKNGTRQRFFGSDSRPKFDIINMTVSSFKFQCCLFLCYWQFLETSYWIQSVNFSIVVIRSESMISASDQIQNKKIKHLLSIIRCCN